MGIGFYWIMAAQFFSALADNALLIAAIAALKELSAPASMAPLLKTSFTVSYVALAAFVGAFADSMPKRRVMMLSNAVKFAGCAMMLGGVHPLAAYAVVGFGAAAYSPAKYGILTELLPAGKLVAANGWIEGLTVGAIILGVVAGGALIRPEVSGALLGFDFPWMDWGVDTPSEAAICAIGALYAAAALLNRKVPDTGVDHVSLKRDPVYLAREFWHCQKLLWKDKLGKVSLAVTTLFWGAGSTLQFIVLDWAKGRLGLELSKASMLQGVVAAGVAAGAVAAAKAVRLENSPKVLPLGILMGLLVPGLCFADSFAGAVPLLVAVGFASGFFVVPMNALLQHRGHVLMGAGHSIAVQNFNENLSILAMTGCYSLLVWAHAPLEVAAGLFGALVAGMMFLVTKRFRGELARDPGMVERMCSQSKGEHDGRGQE